MKLKPIRDQVVVVFGASSGIGRETALEFARKGAKVMASARNEADLDSLVSEIHQNGGEAAYIVAEAADAAQVKAAADAAVERYGRLDTWVHAAGTSIYARFEDTTPEEFRRVIDVNLNGQAYGAMAALPHLRREGRGALIHISSVESQRALAFQAAYAASKHGVKGFLEALRTELEEEGAEISVTNVMPAGINTPLFNKARTKLGVKPMPQPPIYEPATVARVILYCAEHPVRDMYAGGAAKLFSSLEAVAPGLMDKATELTSFEGQKTQEPKAVTDGDGLFTPLPGYGKVRGDFGELARSSSFYNYMETHPAIRVALGASAFGAAAWLASLAAKKAMRS